jgi:hypothetical protein
MTKLLRSLWPNVWQPTHADASGMYGCPVRRFQEIRPAFERELRRARRYERPLSVIVLGTRGPFLSGQSRGHNHNVAAKMGAESSPAAQSSIHYLQFLQLGAVLQDTLRETDIAGHVAERGEYIVVLPEATADAALQTLRRISALLRGRGVGSFRVASAAFPTDGLTLDELIETARATLGVTAERATTKQPLLTLHGNG